MKNEKRKFSTTRAKQRYKAELPLKSLYRFSIGILGPMFKSKVNLKIIKQDLDKVKAPFAVVSNHCSIYDWIYLPIALWPHMLSIVVSTYFFSNPMLVTPLEKIGAIPKDQFTPDVQAAKNMLSVAKMGGNITLFPEGRMSPAGESEYFEFSAIRLLRHINRPVLAAKLEGASLTHPKWAHSDRKGRVDLTVKPLFLEGELETLTDEEAYKRMVDTLSTDEFAWQKKNHVRFKGALEADGLENVCYRCPRCGKDMAMRTEENRIFCSECGNGATINEYYELTPFDESCVIPESPAAWLREEKAIERKTMLEDENFSYSGEVLLRISGEGKKWFTDVGRGVCTLDRSGFKYTGTKFGEPYELFVPLKLLPAVPHTPGKAFEIHRGCVVNRFVPDNLQTTQKWSILAEELHDIVYGGSKWEFRQTTNEQTATIDKEQ